MKASRLILLAGVVIFLSRLPFLFDGYGSEEDAWALRLVAERTATTGVYEVSRLPGHPFQELVYAGLWRFGSVGFNLLTALLSTIGILFFMRALQKLSVQNWLLAGLLVASIPVVYINSTNAMDYTWAMAFLLISFYFLTTKRMVFAGLFLAIATGCRITSAAMWLPFVFFAWNYWSTVRAKHVFLFTLSSVLFSVLIFIPVFINYGTSFFSFYEHFPLPGIAKNLYKGIIAVWGLPLLAVGTSVVCLHYFKKVKPIEIIQHQRLLTNVSLLVIALVTLAFIRVPLKSAFMIPMIPFVALLAALYLDTKSMKYLVFGAIASSFFLGVNLDDPLRGSARSAVAIRFLVGGQPVALDPFQGLLTADRTKRLQRTAYAKQVIQVASTMEKPTAVIAGWWLADILVLQVKNPNKNIKWIYYTDEMVLQKLEQEGYALFYLPQQEEFNDLRFRKTFTVKYASSFPSGS